MTDWCDLELERTIHALRDGEVSSMELTLSYLQRIEQLESQLHAFITITPDLAIKQAEEADKKLGAWRITPGKEIPRLLGIPVAIKDVLCVKDTRCTAGSRILENFTPVYNATVVERLFAEGVVFLGKTNTDEFAMGSSTENSAYGPTHNPWDLERVPGGSSGGSAAAVAAFLAPLALGTDTGGSVRQPASFCGVTGIKPTYGRVSRYGLIAYGSSLDTVGVLGRNAEEISQVFSVIAGHDPLDATSMEIPVPKIVLDASPESELSQLRIGVPQEYFIAGIQTEVEQCVNQAIHVFEEYGAQAVPISLPHTDYALPVYYLIAPAEASANLARFDGVRYGPRAESETMWDVFYRTRGEKFGAEVKRRIMLGTYALSAGYYDAYYGQAQKVRTLIKQDFDRAFEMVDVIAAPVAPSTAFRIGEHSDDPLAMYLEDVFTLPANLAGIPGITFPVGFDKQGLPVGMQLMGQNYREDVLFKSAHAYQQVTKWHTHRPVL
jgi:aspartyl-tRNA(Asn)/glutamyl-tRNA(Gln) amidotransferase subunit A